MLHRLKRRAPEYSGVRNNRQSIPEELLIPYAIERYFENNPIDEGLKADDNTPWKNNDDDDKSLENGLWYNSVEKPRYEVPNSRARAAKKYEKVMKRFKPLRQQADDWKNFDMKNSFYY